MRGPRVPHVTSPGSRRTQLGNYSETVAIKALLSGTSDSQPDRKTLLVMTQHGIQRLHVPLRRVLRLLLEPQQLPGWNPAFLSLGGPREPVHRMPYPIRVRGGLHGYFEYLDIGGRHVSTTWQVPGFRETSTWYLEPRRAATLVRHEFEHHGDDAATLRALAGLSLRRLATHVATADVGLPHPADQGRPRHGPRARHASASQHRQWRADAADHRRKRPAQPR